MNPLAEDTATEPIQEKLEIEYMDVGSCGFFFSPLFAIDAHAHTGAYPHMQSHMRVRYARVYAL